MQVGCAGLAKVGGALCEVMCSAPLQDSGALLRGCTEEQMHALCRWVRCAQHEGVDVCL